MNVVDLMPAIRQRNGEAPPKSGDQLAADLQSIGRRVGALMAIITDQISRDQPEEMRAVQTRMHNLLIQISAINRNNPPSEELLELMSDQVSINMNQIKLMLHQQMLNNTVEQLLDCSVCEQK